MSTKNGSFATMDPDRALRLQSLGGRSVPAEKRAYSRDRELAAVAGRAGGVKTSADREHMRRIGGAGGAKVSADRAHMAEIGRKGAAARAAKKVA